MLNDPFGRSRLPATFDREGRVRLVAEAARILLDHGGPAALFVGGALSAWLQEGGRLGALERDFLRVSAPWRSNATPSRIWAATRSATSEDGTSKMEPSQPESEVPE